MKLLEHIIDIIIIVFLYFDKIRLRKDIKKKTIILSSLKPSEQQVI